jgi:hypothetical protein
LRNGDALEAVKIPDASEISEVDFLDSLEHENNLTCGIKEDKLITKNFEVENFNQIASND